MGFLSFLKPKPAISDNVNRGVLTSTYSPQMNAGVGATNFLQSLLTGQGDTTAAQGGFDAYLKNAGFTNVLQKLQRGIVGGGAASGLLRSGPTATRLLTEGTALNQGMFNNYLQQLAGLSGLGLQAGGIVANAGQRSKGGGPSTAGSIASTIGGIASIFSDRRLKTEIERIGEYPDGLGLYSFRYIGTALRRIGVMADEVSRLRPWALGPQIGGFATVNYGAL